MPRIDIVFTDAGGGHRTVASALQTALQEAGAGWEVRLVNLADALASADPLRSFTGIGIQDAYNLLLRLGMGRIIKAAIPLLHLTIRLRGERQVQEMTRQWIESPPDIVVSAMSHFNGILKEALARARPDAPFVVLMADLADYPPHFWLEKQDQFVICGTVFAELQARSLGIPSRQIFRTEGVIVTPPGRGDAAERLPEPSALGLRTDWPIALVQFGAEGSRKMLAIAKAVRRSSIRCQFLFLTGRNLAVLRKLTGGAFDHRIVAIPFTSSFGIT